MSAFPALPTEPKKLYRDPAKAVLGGVCAGLAEYLNVDVTVVRVVTAVLAIVTFFAVLLAYLVMWALIPPRPSAGRAEAPPSPLQQS